MSAPLAGKFQDHYTLLGVDPRADLEVIKKAHAKLAERYHPDHGEAAHLEKYESVNLAWEILSDKSLRAEFDKIKGIEKDDGGLKFSGVAFFSALGREANLRATVLCLLYDTRRLKPFAPGMSIRVMESMLEVSNEELYFALWYLKQRGFVLSDDKSNLQVTVDGMDYLEQNKPLPEMVLPFIKHAALQAPPTLAKIPMPIPEDAMEPESVLKVLNRALARR
ncbi:MAG TPA: DnaJ domain-containing protein [Bryobacteraceae bacterium]|jgi:curved DNA-binding protein CbpA